MSSDGVDLEPGDRKALDRLKRDQAYRDALREERQRWQSKLGTAVAVLTLATLAVGAVAGLAHVLGLSFH